MAVYTGFRVGLGGTSHILASALNTTALCPKHGRKKAQGGLWLHVKYACFYMHTYVHTHTNTHTHTLASKETHSTQQQGHALMITLYVVLSKRKDTVLCPFLVTFILGPGYHTFTSLLRMSTFGSEGSPQACASGACSQLLVLS